MVRHIVTWNYKDGLSDAENKENALKIKAGLESLPEYIDGIAEIKVYINTLSSSNRDVILNSLFESGEALAAYQVHPEHKKISGFVGTVMQNRVCVDYEE
jgi:hypothetical protein